MGYTVETLYDIECIQRILKHFMSIYHATTASSPIIVEEGQLVSITDTLTPMTMVANLMDGYLAEVAPDVNLKLPKFEYLAAMIPDYARHMINFFTSNSSTLCEHHVLHLAYNPIGS